VRTHSDFHLWGCHVNIWSIFHLDLDECYNRDGSITICMTCYRIMMWLENYHHAKNLNTRLSIHGRIGILGLEHLNEVHIYQYECPKNGRLKQYWLQQALLWKCLPTQWKPIPQGKTFLVMTHFLPTQIWILCIFLEDVPLVCCSQHSKTF